LLFPKKLGNFLFPLLLIGHLPYGRVLRWIFLLFEPDLNNTVNTSLVSIHITESKVLLLDSNDSFSYLFRSLLAKVGVGGNKIFSATSLKEANLVFKKQRPNLCIFDIEDARSMKISIDFATLLREAGENIPIIFLVPNFHHNEQFGKALSYKYSSVLVKDLSPSRLLQAIEHAHLQRENSILKQKYEEANYLTSNVKESVSSKKDGQRLFFKVGDSFKAIDKDKISFFFAENKLTYARVGRRNFPTNVQLKTLEASLNPFFIRCHKKYIINVSLIESISMKDDKIKISDEILPIGYSYRKSFMGSLNLLR